MSTRMVKTWIAMLLFLAVFPDQTVQAQVERREATPNPQTKRVLVVSLSDRRLALIENGEVKRVYRVSVGKASTPSPVGTFTIVTRVSNPTYYHAGEVIAPGPGNPVGTRWMGLSVKGYGIHGTNEPRSVGKAASHGCIRMRRQDLEELFAQVRRGDEVEIVGERNTETAKLFGGVEPAVSTAATEVAAKTEPGNAPTHATESSSGRASAQAAQPLAVLAAAMPVGR